MPPGMPSGGAGDLYDHIFPAPGAKPWSSSDELCTLSVTYPLCGSALTYATDKLFFYLKRLEYPLDPKS